MTTSLQRVIVDRISEGEYYAECHFLPNTRTEGCGVCWIPVGMGTEGENVQTRLCYGYFRGDNGTALVANGTVDDLQLLTTYRVEAFGVNNGQILHPFPIVPDTEMMTDINTTNNGLSEFACENDLVNIDVIVKTIVH